jgi:hypothetical protein
VNKVCQNQGYPLLWEAKEITWTTEITMYSFTTNQLMRRKPVKKHKMPEKPHKDSECGYKSVTRKLIKFTSGLLRLENNND